MEELLKELEKISLDEFMIQMADHLSSDDYRYLNELHVRKMEIKNKIDDLKAEETRNTLNAMYEICYPNNKGGK